MYFYPSDDNYDLLSNILALNLTISQAVRWLYPIGTILVAVYLLPTEINSSIIKQKID